MLLEATDERWRSYAAAHGTSPFHHPAWLELLADCYGWHGLVFAVEGADGQLAAAIPLISLRSITGQRRWISLPFTDACPPVGNSSLVDLADLLDGVRRERQVARVEVRFPLAGAATSPHPRGVVHTLALDGDPGSVFAGFRKGVKSSIHKAERAALVVHRGEAEHDLVDSYYRLHLLTRQRLGVPVQPRRFFRLLWRRFVGVGLGTLLLASSEGRPVAGAVYLHWNGAMVYKYGASDPAYWHLRPNNAIQWEAIRQACRTGCRSFDFGRSDFQDIGLRNFKTGWGATEQPLTYSRLGATSGPPLARGSGAAAAVIRRSPQWMCRMAGELLYRYAA